MKTILILLILSSALAMPAIGALDDADLDKIRLIVKDEIKPIKTDIGTLKTDTAWIRGKLEGIERQISHATNVTYGLIALIVAAIGIPAWRGRRDRSLEKQIETLTQEIETLEQQRIVNP